MPAIGEVPGTFIIFVDVFVEFHLHNFLPTALQKNIPFTFHYPRLSANHKERELIPG